MGSTTVWGTKDISAKEFVERHVFTPGSDRCTLVDISIKSNVAYCAVQAHDEERTVFALIIKLSRHNGDWNYRDMEECMGPYYWDCPARILDRLSPTTDENSLRWRQTCRETIAKRQSKKQPKPGDTVRLAIPVRFSDAVSESVFTCEVTTYRNRNRKLFRRQIDRVLCQLKGLARMSYTIDQTV